MKRPSTTGPEWSLFKENEFSIKIPSRNADFFRCPLASRIWLSRNAPAVDFGGYGAKAGLLEQVVKMILRFSCSSASPPCYMKSKTLFFVVALSSHAVAQNFLDPLIVTASRQQEKAGDSTHSVTSLDQAYIEENARRSLPEVLQFTPGVLVQKTAHGHGSPYVRGFTGRQNLLLVDGVRINNSTWRSGPVQYWNTIDSYAIDHIELIRSQGSVPYGSDAAGGTMNVFSRSSDFRAKEDGKSYQGGAARYEFRSNGQGSHIGRVEAETGIGGTFGMLLGTTLKEFGDIESDAIGRMRGTGYPEQDVDFRADWALSPDATLTLAHQSINQDDVSRWHRTSANPGWKGAVAGTWTANTYDQERSLTYLKYSGENPEKDAAVQKWNATLSWQASTDSEFQNRTGDPAAGTRPFRRTSIETDTLGLDVSLESALAGGTFIYGTDYYHDRVDSGGSQSNASGSNRRESLPIGDNSSYELFGVYSQYAWKPADPVEMTAGLRYSDAEADIGRYYDSANVERPGTTHDWDSLVASLRADYRLTQTYSLFGGVSQAFRAPNLDDLSGNMTSKSGSTSLGSLDVDPETFLTYEVGVRHRNDDVTMELAVFYTDVEDLITGVPVTSGSSTTVTTNASDAYIYGVEWQGAWKFATQWTLSGFAAWQDGRQTAPAYVGGPETEGFTSKLLPLSGGVSLRWTSADARYWLEGRFTAADRQDHLAPGDKTDTQRIPPNGTPGYLVASLYSGWDVNRHLTLHCGIENLTDADYRIHGSGQNEPGLNGIVGIKVSW